MNEGSSLSRGNIILLKEKRGNEWVRGRKARGPQVARGNKLQVTELFAFSVDDTRFCINLTFLKLWANQCVLLMEMLFLRYVNETIYLLWNLLFFKLIPVLPIFFFFLFSNLGLIMAQQTSIHVNCFMAGDDTPCAILSQKCILWERGLVKLPQAWGVSLIWLISLLTDIK